MILPLLGERVEVRGTATFDHRLRRLENTGCGEAKVRFTARRRVRKICVV
jgi:hypothetical protein